MDYVEFSELLNRVQSGLNILDVIQKSANLRQDGEFYVGRCPFHEDSEESLIVNPVAGKFYCRSCHVSGGVLQFISLTEKISLDKAFKTQANLVGEDLYTKRRDFEDEKFVRGRRELLEINDYARDFYHEILTSTEEGESCRKYLESRGITNGAIEKFQLGFSTSAERQLAKFLNDFNFQFTQMLSAGLIERLENSLFDRFRECITIPLLDAYGHTAAIIGQDVNFEKKIFYETDGVHSPYIYPAKENSIFNKRRLLFGVDAAKRSIVQSKKVLVVEGCLEAIAFHCAGIENVVATFEKNFTSEHAEHLMQFAEEIIFCVKNGDELQLAEEALKAVLNDDGKISVVALPKNPAEFVVEIGKELFLKRLENRVLFNEYEHSKKTSVLTEQAKQYTAQLPKNKIPLIDRMGETILKRMWHEVGILSYTLAILPKEIFEPLHQEVIEYLKICAEENKRPNKDTAKDYLGDEVDEKFLDRLCNANVYSDAETEAYEDAVERLIRETKKINYDKTKVEIFKDDAKYNKHIEKLMKYQEES